MGELLRVGHRLARRGAAGQPRGHGGGQRASAPVEYAFDAGPFEGLDEPPDPVEAVDDVRRGFVRAGDEYVFAAQGDEPSGRGGDGSGAGREPACFPGCWG